MYINVGEDSSVVFRGSMKHTEMSYTDVELEDGVDHVVVLGSASVSVDAHMRRMAGCGYGYGYGYGCGSRYECGSGAGEEQRRDGEL